MDLKELAKEYFKSVNDMQLATVSNGKPWVCTVYFVADDENNLYWTSGRDRQHSLEILSDSSAAVTVVKDREKKQAIQLAGIAEEVNDKDLERVHNLYQSKFGQKDYDLEEMKEHKPSGRAYWVFTPETIMFWDEVNFPEQPKQKLL
ncbi:pyridoxamine 5'-phosphate oxidase family protein [Candidatus Saccharibacteria bacterium]|nr:pyridoxamine 5'-phosphate oxidase family protein [Candidatus Saccharibacteria bacterium]